MSDTIRRTKYREVDPMVVDLKKEIEKIALEEAILEAEQPLLDDEDLEFLGNSYNPLG